MKSTESLIQDIFAILAFVTIFFIRVIVGSVKLAIYIYRTIQERTSIQETELSPIAEPVTEMLISPEAIEVRKKAVKLIKLLVKFTVRGVVFLYVNAPAFYQDAMGFCTWVYDSISSRFAPKPTILSLNAAIED